MIFHQERFGIVITEFYEPYVIRLRSGEAVPGQAVPCFVTQAVNKRQPRFFQLIKEADVKDHTAVEDLRKILQFRYGEL